jgi:hypothetical protein
MRFTLILAVAAILTPAALSARTVTPQASGIEAATDLSAATKKKKARKAAAPKEEYLKAAPGTGPSGPQRPTPQY